MTMCWTRRNNQGRWPQWIVSYWTITLIITLIEIINTTRSETRSCLRNAGKMGKTKAAEKRLSRDPGEIWITLLATNVERKATILGTLNASLKPISNRTQRHSGRQNRKNIQQATWWRRPKIIGKRQTRFVQSYDGSPHRGMGWTTISCTHVLPNLNTRRPTDWNYKQQYKKG